MPVAHRPPTSPHVFALANVERTVSMCQNVDTSLSPLSSFGDTKSAKWAVAVPVQRQVISVFVSGLRHIFNDVAVAVALRLDAADSGERESPNSRSLAMISFHICVVLIGDACTEPRRSHRLPVWSEVFLWIAGGRCPPWRFQGGLRSLVNCVLATRRLARSSTGWNHRDISLT